METNLAKEMFTFVILGFYLFVYTLIEKFRINGNYQLDNEESNPSLIEDYKETEKNLLEMKSISKTYRGLDFWKSTKALKNIKN